MTKVAEVLREKLAGMPDQLHVRVHTAGTPRPKTTACGLPTAHMNRSSDPQGQMDRLQCPGCVAALEV